MCSFVAFCSSIPMCYPNQSISRHHSPRCPATAGGATAHRRAAESAEEAQQRLRRAPRALEGWEGHRGSAHWGGLTCVMRWLSQETAINRPLTLMNVLFDSGLRMPKVISLLMMLIAYMMIPWHL